MVMLMDIAVFADILRAIRSWIEDSSRKLTACSGLPVSGVHKTSVVSEGGFFRVGFRFSKRRYCGSLLRDLELTSLIT